MKNNFIICSVILIISLISALPSQAGTPLWTFTPLTATTISMSANSTATVQYQITNQSSRTHTLAINSIKGVTPITSGVGVCTNPFMLMGHTSCILNLQIDGSQIAAGDTNGPVVCQQGSALQCYKPSVADTLNVNITNAQYNVTPLSMSVSTLALSVGCPSAGGSCIYSNAALTGHAREIIITNTSSMNTTTPLMVTPAGFPAGTTITTDNCTGATLAPSSTCSIIITPGQAATSACTSGIAPTPGTLTVNASSASSPVASDIVVLSYACIYQGGFVYSIDDTTAIIESIAGKTAAVNDTYVGQITPVPGDPNWGGMGTDVGSSTWETSPLGANNGGAVPGYAGNTETITSALGCTSSTSPSYAACLCTNLSVDAAGSPCTSPSICYTNWSLPAICELAPFSGLCTAGSTNIQEQLYNASPAMTANFVDDAYYWSSTEYSSDPQNTAWYEHFVTSGSSQGADNKDLAMGIRCTRKF